MEVINHQMEHVQSTKRICTSSPMIPSKINCITMRFGASEAVTIGHISSLTYCMVNGASAKGGDIFNWLKVSNSDRQVIVMEAGQCKRVEKLNVAGLSDEVKKATPKGGVFVLYTTADLPYEFDTSGYCTSFFVTRANYQKYFGPFAGRAFLRSR